MPARRSPFPRSMVMRITAAFCLCLSLPAAQGYAAQTRSAGEPAISVFAAASLTDLMATLGTAWVAAGHKPPRLVFGPSSLLAHQIDDGAPADVFISADEAWMDRLAGHAMLLADARHDIAGNALVLIGAPGAPAVTLAPGADFSARLGATGRLAIADPSAVPAGRYAQAALKTLGIWDKFAAHLVPAQDVRAALVMVETGEAPLGIVYATDALTSKKIAVLAHFPTSTHPAIRYPAAGIVGGNAPLALSFLTFLQSPTATAIISRNGFTLP